MFKHNVNLRREGEEELGKKREAQNSNTGKEAIRSKRGGKRVI